MPNFIPITQTDFAEQRWQRIPNYNFAANDSMCPLVVQELPQAQLSLPIGFARIKEQYAPVALQGLKASSNALVDSQGQWTGRYIPAAYRSYPFALANSDDDQKILCFDQDSGLLSDNEGESFFDEKGDPSIAVQKIMEFLVQVAANRDVTQRICKLLDQHQLIQPWLITLKHDDGETPIEGLYRIDEAALNALDKETFDDIRRAGSLPLIYCQLLSMQHLQALVAVVSKRQQKQNAPEPLDIDKLFGEGEDLFKF